ncbi:MAG TPA: outer membrane beta-barrel protein [Puia sp.]|jgi:hypothetical protein|nr:outer membrane beta-barrel protein [Puia sp.]
MKKQLLLVAGVCAALTSLAQNDTSAKNNGGSGDTLHVGSMIIVRNGNEHNGDGTEVTIHRRNSHKPPNMITSWFQFDLGFANFNDKTNYGSAAAQQFAPGSTADWFNLRTIKSVDVNIWFFMQRLNAIKHVVNLEYGLGLELNNYRYTENIKYLKNPTEIVMSPISYRKNKLAADYITVPFMLNFNFTPHRDDGFGFSVGVSAGYLYSSRQKLISSETGKTKTHDNFDLQPWKISWIGEIQLGPVRLYGSYATQSMFKKGLDQTPYTAGIRFPIPSIEKD